MGGLGKEKKKFYKHVRTILFFRLQLLCCAKKKSYFFFWKRVSAIFINIFLKYNEGCKNGEILNKKRSTVFPRSFYALAQTSKFEWLGSEFLESETHKQYSCRCEKFFKKNVKFGENNCCFKNKSGIQQRKLFPKLFCKDSSCKAVATIDFLVRIVLQKTQNLKNAFGKKITLLDFL